MNTIAKVNFPNQSILYPNKYHYTDSYQGLIDDPENKITPLVLTKAFVSSAPTWVDKLMELRNYLVSFVGLKTVGLKTGEHEKMERMVALNNFEGEKGEELGIFKAYDKTATEIILGEDDKHLDFRISLMVQEVAAQQKEITISTTVVFHNWVGKLYFLPVKPFHRLIVPIMLKGVLKNLKEKQL